MKMDKFIVQGSKRKKRHTRRNLDEIRKRTFQVHNNNNTENIAFKLLRPKVTNCITNSRLTLANKAIRSETVTRSILSKLGKGKNKKFIVLPNREETITTKISNVSYKKETIPFKINSNLKSPLCNYMEINNQTTSDSIVFFSSLDSEKKVNNITCNDVLLDSWSSAPTTFITPNENSLYNEFMTNIVDYIEETASNFFKTDRCNKNKDFFNSNFLQNEIYNNNIPGSQSHRNKYSDKTKLSVSSHDEDIILNNPKSQTNIQDSLETSWNALNPVFCQFHESNLQKLSNSSACCDQDSPEYFYYPHRLNK